MKTQYCQLRQYRIVEVRRNEIKSRLARYAVYKTIVRNKKNKGRTTVQPTRLEVQQSPSFGIVN